MQIAHRAMAVLTLLSILIPAYAAALPPYLARLEPITALPEPPPADLLRAELGRSLFGDMRLSGDGKRSCASCHDLATNGASANRHDLAPDGSELALNTSTVFNTSLSFRLNWEGNVRTLEEQATSSLTRTDIMGTTPEAAAARLRADPEVSQRFHGAYGHEPDAAALLDAIASFERTLLTPGSRFDRWLGGAADALTADELDGYRLFKSIGCSSCHQGVNIGGNLYQEHGVFKPVGAPEPKLLRVPSLRNIATTPPYFHDGSTPNLNDAINTMAEAQLGRSLSEPQVGQIAAFLRSLTGNYRGQPVTSPAP